MGGDKDGHPGVDDKVMLSSLQLARLRLLEFLARHLEEAKELYGLTMGGSQSSKRLALEFEKLGKVFRDLKKIKPNDYKVVLRTQKILAQLALSYHKVVGIESPGLRRMLTLFKVFPGLVVPLEIREDSQVIADSKKNPNLQVVKMVQMLKKIGGPQYAHFYVRGFVISMCESSQDVKNTVDLFKRHLGQLQIPIVPLFETKAALEKSTVLSAEILGIPTFKEALKKKWDNKFEIMVGYSDSAKESGSLFSRSVIEKSLVQLERLIKGKGYTPIFFHGSGGSVARGGGSLKEQMAWWPKTARQRFKATIQGEMIHRTFSSVEIFNRQISKIREVSRQSTKAVDKDVALSVRRFAESTRSQYNGKVTNPEFMDMVSKVTPYPYLDQLKIGSRPSKRKSEFNLRSLRAIPWVLCWTQTRVLFPVWWGVGSSWKELAPKERTLLRRAYKESCLFRSYVRVLAYTLAKVDMSVWGFYLEKSSIQEEKKSYYYKEFCTELALCKKFLKEVSGEGSPLWFRPWLLESIRLRSTLIYPLNLLEVIALKKPDVPLLRESVTGVASGMLTTG